MKSLTRGYVIHPILEGLYSFRDPGETVEIGNTHLYSKARTVDDRFLQS